MATFIRCDVKDCEEMTEHDTSAYGTSPVPRGWGLLACWIPIPTGAAGLNDVITDAVDEIDVSDAPPSAAAYARLVKASVAQLALAAPPQQSRMVSVVICPNHKLPAFRTSTARNIEQASELGTPILAENY